MIKEVSTDAEAWRPGGTCDAVALAIDLHCCRVSWPCQAISLNFHGLIPSRQQQSENDVEKLPSAPFSGRWAEPLSAGFRQTLRAERPVRSLQSPRSNFSLPSSRGDRSWSMPSGGGDADRFQDITTDSGPHRMAGRLPRGEPDQGHPCRCQHHGEVKGSRTDEPSASKNAAIPFPLVAFRLPAHPARATGRIHCCRRGCIRFRPPDLRRGHSGHHRLRLPGGSPASLARQRGGPLLQPSLLPAAKHVSCRCLGPTGSEGRS